MEFLKDFITPYESLISALAQLPYKVVAWPKVLQIRFIGKPADLKPGVPDIVYLAQLNGIIVPGHAYTLYILLFQLNLTHLPHCFAM